MRLADWQATNAARSVHFKHVALHGGSQPTERLLPAELRGVVAPRIVRAALHKAFTAQCLGEPVRPQAPDRRGRGRRDGAEAR